MFNGDSLKWTLRFDVAVNGTGDPADAASVVAYNPNAGDMKGTVVAEKVFYWKGWYATLLVNKIRKEAEKIAQQVRDYFADDQENKCMR